MIQPNSFLASLEIILIHKRIVSLSWNGFLVVYLQKPYSDSLLPHFWHTRLPLLLDPVFCPNMLAPISCMFNFKNTWRKFLCLFLACSSLGCVWQVLQPFCTWHASGLPDFLLLWTHFTLSTSFLVYGTILWTKTLGLVHSMLKRGSTIVFFLFWGEVGDCA